MAQPAEDPPVRQCNGDILTSFARFCCFLLFYDKTSDEKAERVSNYRTSLKKGDKVVTTAEYTVEYMR
jgi:preprotein translocase subunit YajC